VPQRVSPEAWLARALSAKTASQRGLSAQRGLAAKSSLDIEIQALLLRQLHLAYLEKQQFDRAETCALQGAALGVLADVMLQDAARAAAGRGDLAAAIRHLRKAVRLAPADRRAFHHWTLGANLLLAKRYASAAVHLQRAAMQAPSDAALYRAHWALACVCMGREVPQLQRIVDELVASANHAGYGTFVLGHLAYAAREWTTAERYLTVFVQRTTDANLAKRLSLRGELAMAQATLNSIQHN
jgi:tetratricopeptide (TPR) repeat protein